jgi:hypothetical protein
MDIYSVKGADAGTGKLRFDDIRKTSLSAYLFR